MPGSLPTRRRISYTIPPPTDPLPQFQLPPFAISRNGSTGPLLIPSPSQKKPIASTDGTGPRHPRHRLGVVSLALDTSTLLAGGRAAPEGILYSGARDGLVCSWDLGFPMKKKKGEPPLSPSLLRRGRCRWEVITGWGDDAVDEECGEEGVDDKPRNGSDGDVLGEVGSTRKKIPAHTDGSVPYEFQWETDSEAYQPEQVRPFHKFRRKGCMNGSSRCLAIPIPTVFPNPLRLGERSASV